MPQPYSPVNSNQIQQRKRVFIGADMFLASGTATLTRGGKGNWYWAVAASLTVDFANTLDLNQMQYDDARVNYALNNNLGGNIGFNGATAIYQATGAALTVATLGISQSLFPSAATPAVTDIIAPTALALPLNANIQQVPIVLANNAILAVTPSQILTEAIFQTAASGVLHFYGVILDLRMTRA